MDEPAQILGFLFLGSRKAAKNKALLLKLGVRYILNVTPTRDVDPVAGVPCFFDREGMFQYKRVPVFDSHGEDLHAHFESCISFIEQGRHYGAVLVHCNKGVSRSVAVVAAYLMKTRRLAAEQALGVIKRKRAMVRRPFAGPLCQFRPP